MTERADRLHREAVVVDTCGPDGPAVYTPEMQTRLDELEARKAPAGEFIETTASMTHDALLHDGLDDYWSGWEASGVDVSCLTIGIDWGPRPFTYEAAMRDLERYGRLFDELDRLVKITSAADAERAHRDGNAGLVLAFQNTSIRYLSFEGDLA